MSIDLNEYLGLPTARHNTKYYVNEKIEILYDFCILKRGYNNRIPDPLEDAVRSMLTACGTEAAMTDCLRDIIYNDKPITKLLAQKGVLH